MQKEESFKVVSENSDSGADVADCVRDDFLRPGLSDHYQEG